MHGTLDPVPADGTAAAGEHPTLWACPQASALLLRQWDDDAAVVYDHSTGHTHLIDALAAQLLGQLLPGQALSPSTLALGLHGQLADPAPAEPTALVAQGLDTLCALGLASPGPAVPR